MKPNGSWLVLGDSHCFHTNGEAPLTCGLWLARTDPLRTPALFAEQTIDRPLTCGISTYMLRAGQAARIIVSTWKQCIKDGDHGRPFGNLRGSPA
jgi:hypothetical protein